MHRAAPPPSSPAKIFCWNLVPHLSYLMFYLEKIDESHIILGVSENRGFSPQIIHLLIRFSIIFTIHFGSIYPYFWVNAPYTLDKLLIVMAKLVTVYQSKMDPDGELENPLKLQACHVGESISPSLKIRTNPGFPLHEPYIQFV